MPPGFKATGRSRNFVFQVFIGQFLKGLHNLARGGIGALIGHDNILVK
jgi:hypothetical protein